MVILAQLSKAAWVVDGLQQVGLGGTQRSVFVLGAVACRVLVAGDTAQHVIAQFMAVIPGRGLRKDVAIRGVLLAVEVAPRGGGRGPAAFGVIRSDRWHGLGLPALW